MSIKKLFAQHDLGIADRYANSCLRSIPEEMLTLPETANASKKNLKDMNDILIN